MRLELEHNRFSRWLFLFLPLFLSIIGIIALTKLVSTIIHLKIRVQKASHPHTYNCFKTGNLVR